MPVRSYLTLRALRILTLPALVLSAVADNSGPIIQAGAISEFQMDLTKEMRAVASENLPRRVTSLRVAIAAPANFDSARLWPVMVISASSDPGYNSSRALLRRYAPTAMSAGWILVAADPLQRVTLAQDSHQLRLVLANAALTEMEKEWKLASSAPLAFGGYSGGAKHSGVLAAEFAARKRLAIGVFQGGINIETLASSGRRLRVLDEDYLRIPVFLAGGEIDTIATPSAHRAVAAALKKAGFEHVRLEFNALAHKIDPAMLEVALEWFDELAGATPDAEGG
jgi:predicted esterase